VRRSPRRFGVFAALGLFVGLLGAGGEEALGRGERAWRAGDAAGALTAWSEGLRDARAAGDRTAELDLLLRLAAVNRQIGRLKSASDVLDLASPLATTDLDRGRVSLDRGLLLLASGDARSAEARFQEAFEGLQRAGDAPGAANAALDLGLARAARGDDVRARTAFEGALTLFTALKDPSGQASARVQLARVDRRAGRLSEALTGCEDAVGSSLLGGDAATLVEAQLLRGTVLRELGRTEAARASLLAALETARSRKDVASQARLLNALGGLLHDAGDGAAAGHYRAAEQAFVSIGDGRSALAVAVNAAMLDGADAGELRALLTRAEQVGDRRIQAVLGLNLAALGDRSRLAELGRLVDGLGLGELVWRHRHLAGIAAIEAGRTKEGAKLLEQAVDELERRRRSLDEGDERSFVTRHADVYDALIDALLDAGDAPRALVYAQRLQLLDSPAPSDPRLAELVAEEAHLANEAGSARDPEQQAAIAARLADLRVRFAATVDTLRSTYEDFDRLVRVDPEDLEAVQAGLPAGVTVLQPLLFPDRIALLVFSRDRLEAREVPVDGAAVEKQILKLSRSLQAAHVRDPAWTTAQADALGALFVAPVADLLDGTRTLVVSATGPLRELPFALLRHDGRWLIEDRSVVGVTHVGSLAGRSTPFRMDGSRVLLVGDPDGTLPGAMQEVDRLRSRLPAARSLVGAEGTREAFVASAAGAQVVHLATHGVIDRDHPDRSYLVLHGQGEVGRLSYREIPGLAPALTDCRLVVLSACQSGLAVDARTSTDADGGIVISINGLAAQFRRAGVETLVASLWRVDDAATLALMTGFYDELVSGSDVAEALRRAQLRLLAEPSTSHPWYWSGFVVVGDWR
jgi:CHAT domain-containing protein/tetratricopeptide (TPR) repeat protein